MGPLWECMQKNVDYYAPQLTALQAGKGPNAGSSSGDPNANSADDPNNSGESSEPSSATEGMPVDIDKLTDKDIEAYLERLDKEEGSNK